MTTFVIGRLIVAMTDVHYGEAQIRTFRSNSFESRHWVPLFVNDENGDHHVHHDCALWRTGNSYWFRGELTHADDDTERFVCDMIAHGASEVALSCSVKRSQKRFVDGGPIEEVYEFEPVSIQLGRFTNCPGCYAWCEKDGMVDYLLPREIRDLAGAFYDEYHFMDDDLNPPDFGPNRADQYEQNIRRIADREEEDDLADERERLEACNDQEAVPRQCGRITSDDLNDFDLLPPITAANVMMRLLPRNPDREGRLVDLLLRSGRHHLASVRVDREILVELRERCEAMIEQIDLDPDPERPPFINLRGDHFFDDVDEPAERRSTMGKYLDWYWQNVEAAEGEEPTNLLRLVLPDDELLVKPKELIRFLVNTASFLHKSYPDADHLFPEVKLALAASVASTWKWLNIVPNANSDERLNDPQIQRIMFENWFKQYPDTLLDAELCTYGAVELLQKRGAVHEPLEQLVQSMVQQVNNFTLNPARFAALDSINAAGMTTPDELGWVEMTEELEIRIEAALKHHYNALSEVLTAHTKEVIDPVDLAEEPSGEIADTIIEALHDQYAENKRQPVFMTKAMKDYLVAAAHRYSYQCLEAMSRHYGVGYLCVSGPRTAQVVHVDRHGSGRPMALYAVMIRDL